MTHQDYRDALGAEAIGRSVFEEDEVVYHKDIDSGSHKTITGVFGRTDYGLSPDIEAGVDHDRMTGSGLKGLKDFIGKTVLLYIYRLDPG